MDVGDMAAAAAAGPAAKIARLDATAAAGSASLPLSSAAGAGVPAKKPVAPPPTSAAYSHYGAHGAVAPTPGKGLHSAAAAAGSSSSSSGVGYLNPLLPKTPAARRPRKGEVIVGFSANGSPLGAIRCVTRRARLRLAVVVPGKRCSSTTSSVA